MHVAHCLQQDVKEWSGGCLASFANRQVSGLAGGEEAKSLPSVLERTVCYGLVCAVRQLLRDSHHFSMLTDPH